MKPLHVAGLGLWAPGFPNLDAWLAGVSDPNQTEPPCTLLPARMARRASLLTRMAIETVSQAGAEAKVNLGAIPTVFSTARGEMQTLCDLLEQLAGDGQLSPTRFHNSVYNAAAGQFSVAAANQAQSTTVVAGDETVPMALLEAFCLAFETGAPAVIVAFADEAISLPLPMAKRSEALACAVCLTRDPPQGHSTTTITAPARDLVRMPSPLPDLFLSNPVRCVLPLFAALRKGTRGPVSLETPDGWTVEIAGATA